MSTQTRMLAFSESDVDAIQQAYPVPQSKGPSKRKLGELTVQLEVYDQRAQTVLQKLAGVLGIRGNVTKLGLVHSATRYTIIRNNGDPRRPEQKWGVAARLLVATTSISFRGALTIPIVAASAELGLANAQVGIHVRGYTGNLGTLIPAASALNVESYATYMAAFNEIQKRVFADEANQEPVLLEAETQV